MAKVGIVLIILATMPIIPAFAQERPTLCFEDVTDMCGLLSGDPTQTFAAMMSPLESQLEGFGLVVLWGGILGIIWFKTENIMLMGIVGIAIGATITGLSSEALGIGMLMLGVSFGILLFQLIRQRPAIFS